MRVGLDEVDPPPLDLSLASIDEAVRRSAQSSIICVNLDSDVGLVERIRRESSSQVFIFRLCAFAHFVDGQSVSPNRAREDHRVEPLTSRVDSRSDDAVAIVREGLSTIVC